jgi:hypothetical protein
LLSPQSLQKKCDARSWAACDSLAYRYEKGEGVAEDTAKAGALYERACTAGFGESCANLAFLYDGGALGTDAAKVLRLYTRSCALKAGVGCYQLGTSYLNGEGVPKDLLQVACNANVSDVASACGWLSDLYEKGTGVTKDRARAAILRAQSCRLGDTISCRSPAASAAAKAATTSCPVVKVQIGSYTAASVQSDIARRGGSASAGTNNGRPTLSAMSGDYADAGDSVMSVNYTFDASGPAGRLIGLTIVNHANSASAFEKLLAARQAAAATVSPRCSLRLVPNADTWFIYEIYELK